MAHKGTRHHCGVCGKGDTSTCIKKGHIIICKEHNVKYCVLTRCVLCVNEEKRQEKADRRARLQAVAANTLPRKKTKANKGGEQAPATAEDEDEEEDEENVPPPLPAGKRKSRRSESSMSGQGSSSDKSRRASRDSTDTQLR